MKDPIEISNAIIKSVSLGTTDRGLLDAWLQLDYGGSGQGFGGYALYLPPSWAHHEKSASYAGHFIFRVLEVADVTEWGQLVGKCVRVKHDWGKVHAIGHIIKDVWFDPETEFGAIKAYTIKEASK